MDDCSSPEATAASRGDREQSNFHSHRIIKFKTPTSERKSIRHVKKQEWPLRSKKKNKKEQNKSPRKAKH